MLQTLQLLELSDYSAITKVANFATLVSTYTEGLCSCTKFFKDIILNCYYIVIAFFRLQSHY